METGASFTRMGFFNENERFCARKKTCSFQKLKRRKKKYPFFFSWRKSFYERVLSLKFVCFFATQELMWSNLIGYTNKELRTHALNHMKNIHFSFRRDKAFTNEYYHWDKRSPPCEIVGAKTHCWASKTVSHRGPHAKDAHGNQSDPS